MSNRTQTPMAARTKILLEAPVLATLFRLAAPNVFNLLALAGLITFDALIVGRLGADPLVGVSLVFPFVMFVQHVAASGVGGAVSSAIARALGAGDRQRANALCLHAFVLAIVMAAVLTVLMLSVGSTIYRLMGGHGVSLEAAIAYSNAAFSGVIAVCMLNILANVVRGAGNMSLPALVLVGSVLGHVALSPLLIFGWGPLPALGVAGAGLGLVISFALGSLVLFLHLRSRRSLVRLAFTQGRLEWPLFREILRVGIPGMMNVAITNLAVVMITAVAARLGPEAAIGYAMGARLEYIMIPIAFGFGTALVALVGTNWGAQQYARVRRIGWTGALTVAAFCGAIGVFLPSFRTSGWRSSPPMMRSRTLARPICALPRRATRSSAWGWLGTS